MATSTTRLKKAIRAYLGVQVGLNVREYVSGRVYANFAPEGATLPHIVFNQIRGDEEQNLSSVSELAKETFQFDVYSNDADECDIVGQALRLDLQRWRGTFDSIFVRNALLVRAGDSYDGPNDGTDLPQYRFTLDFDIWYIRERAQGD